MSPSSPENAKPSPTGQTEWFTAEVAPHGGQLRAWLHSQFPSVRDEVDDVVQESYLRIWKAKAVQPIQSAKAFLFKVAQHLALDTLRRKRVSPLQAGCDSAASLVIDAAPDAVQTLLNQELFNHAVEALMAVPARYRNVIILHKLKGLSHREVAARLNLTERTAQKYCSVGMERCAQHLKSKGIHAFFT